MKSCAACALQECAFGALGAEHDRRYAFVGPDGHLLTQRQLPALACIRASVGPGALELDFSGLERCELRAGDCRTPTEVRLGQSAYAGLAAPGEISALAAQYLGCDARLVRLGPQARHAFCDAEPVLVASVASLAALNAMLEAPVAMDRFRANVVLEACEAFAELGWRSLAAPTLRLQCAAPCERCEVTTVDQPSGARTGPEPLRTIAARLGGVFGIYCRVAAPGVLALGEALAPQ